MGDENGEILHHFGVSLPPEGRHRRHRELSQFKGEVDTTLRGNKYTTLGEERLLHRHWPLRNITHQLSKQHLHGLTRSLNETLAWTLAREGSDILKDRLAPAQHFALNSKTVLCRFPTDHMPVVRGPDITNEGEVYWVSFENEDLWVTEDMTSEVLELLGPNEHYMPSL